MASKIKIIIEGNNPTRELADSIQQIAYQMMSMSYDEDPMEVEDNNMEIEYSIP